MEPSVRSCFGKAGAGKDMIEALHFLNWMKQEPQSMVCLKTFIHSFILYDNSHMCMRSFLALPKSKLVHPKIIRNIFSK